MARLQERYKSEIVSTMMEDFGYSNVMQVPRLEKIVLNIGLGEALQNVKALDAAARDAARKARAGDQRRFAAFVAGLTEALADPDKEVVVTAALSPLQQRALRLAEEDLG